MQNLPKDQKNGTTFHATQVNLRIEKIETSSRSQAVQLQQGQERQRHVPGLVSGIALPVVLQNYVNHFHVDLILRRPVVDVIHVRAHRVGYRKPRVKAAAAGTRPQIPGFVSCDLDIWSLYPYAGSPRHPLGGPAETRGWMGCPLRHTGGLLTWPLAIQFRVV
jgi:hypothetical protein